MDFNANLYVMADKNRKEEGIFIRLSTEEKQALQRAAERHERKVADYARVVFRERLRELGLLPNIEEAKQ
ncbi:MAG: hypothetical protein JO150_15725 [Acidobacteriaceae bacterium]|nr:hypothetical protein [Acidobacteriaceae bacterium]